MFCENLKTMREAKGYTQEELAIKLNVVRQTVSKWEKGLSVPDADILSKMADLLEVKVSDLLGGTVTEEADRDTVADQLAKISEQLAIRNRRSKMIWKIVGIILAVVVVVNLLIAILYGVNKFQGWSGSESTSVIEIAETETDTEAY